MAIFEVNSMFGYDCKVIYKNRSSLKQNHYAKLFQITDPQGMLIKDCDLCNELFSIQSNQNYIVSPSRVF